MNQFKNFFAVLTHIKFCENWREFCGKACQIRRNKFSPAGCINQTKHEFRVENQLSKTTPQTVRFRCLIENSQLAKMFQIHFAHTIPLEIGKVVKNSELINPDLDQ